MSDYEVFWKTAVACAFGCFLICSCDGGASSDSEEEPDIRLNSTHCVISESDQEPIVIDAEVLELYSETDTVVMRNVIFRQNKKDSENKEYAESLMRHKKVFLFHFHIRHLASLIRGSTKL